MLLYHYNLRNLIKDGLKEDSRQLEVVHQNKNFFLFLNQNKYLVLGAKYFFFGGINKEIVD